MEIIKYLEDLLERFSSYLATLRARLGAWIVDSLGEFARLAFRFAMVAAKILTLMLCPYFAWASVGEYFIRNSGIYLAVLGAFIIIIFPAFVLADVLRTVLQSSGALFASTRMYSKDQIIDNLAHELGQADPSTPPAGWLSEWGSWLTRIFVSERRDIYAYYAIFVGIAVVITVAMLSTNFGGRLSETVFGNLNILILTLIFRGPVWLASTAFQVVAGVTIAFDTTVLKRVLDLPEDSSLWSYTWPFLLAVLLIVFIGWLLFWLRGTPVASQEDQSSERSGASTKGHRWTKKPSTRSA